MKNMRDHGMGFSTNKEAYWQENDQHEATVEWQQIEEDAEEQDGHQDGEVERILARI